MADRKIDQAKAKNWIADVKAELDSVDRVLVAVGNVCKDMPNEDDSFVQLIETTGTFIDDAWREAKNGFKSAWDKIESAIDDIGRVGSEVAEKIDEFAKKIR